MTPSTLLFPSDVTSHLTHLILHAQPGQANPPGLHPCCALHQVPSHPTISWETGSHPSDFDGDVTSYRKLSLMSQDHVSCPTSGPMPPSLCGGPHCITGACLLDHKFHIGRNGSPIPQGLESSWTQENVIRVNQWVNEHSGLASEVISCPPAPPRAWAGVMGSSYPP